MTKRFAMYALLVAIPLLVWALVWAISRDFSKPNAEIFTEMAHSFAAETLDQSTVLPGGIVQQPPPEGSIYRGQGHFPFAPGPEEATRAGAEWQMPEPLRVDAALAARGARVFRNACTTCHGDRGQGNDMLAAAGFPKPPSLTADRAKSLSDGQLYHIIVHGQGAMAPHATHVSPADRWAVVEHLRTLQGGRK